MNLIYHHVFLIALFYNDTSGLSEEDCEALEEFVNDLHVFGITSPLYDASGIETYWERCDITHLHDTCVKLKVYECTN